MKGVVALVVILLLLIGLGIGLYFVFRPCSANCSGKKCGDKDGCGGYCGCGKGETCNNGVCCVRKCESGVCGEDDGCGGRCGCGSGERCVNGKCCVKKCNGGCGVDDGCGGECSCEITQDCVEKKCVDRMIWKPVPFPDHKSNEPNVKCVLVKSVGDPNENTTEHACLNTECLKGTCCSPTQKWNTDSWRCDDVCQPTCVGRKCGGDGCGGNCGDCNGNEDCIDNQCVLGNWTADPVPPNMNFPVCVRKAGVVKESKSETEVACLNDLCSRVKCCDTGWSYSAGSGHCSKLPSVWILVQTSFGGLINSFKCEEVDPSKDMKTYSKNPIVVGINDTHDNCVKAYGRTNPNVT